MLTPMHTRRVTRTAAPGDVDVEADEADEAEDATTGAARREGSEGLAKNLKQNDRSHSHRTTRQRNRLAYRHVIAPQSTTIESRTTMVRLISKEKGRGDSRSTFFQC
jgi:hypothetical protein